MTENTSTAVIRLDRQSPDFGNCLRTLRKCRTAHYDASTQTWHVEIIGAQTRAVVDYCTARGARLENA